MDYWFLLIPFLSALTGWLLNSLLMKRLFRPMHPKKIFGITYQGAFPAKQNELAEKIGTIISEKIFSVKELEEKITAPSNFEKLMPVVEEHIDLFLKKKLVEQMPMISMFIGEKTIRQLKKIFMDELQALFPEIIKNYLYNLQSGTDLKKIIVQKITSLHPEKAETAFFSTLSKETRNFKMAGALTGFIAGIIQVLLTLAISSVL